MNPDRQPAAPPPVDRDPSQEHWRLPSRSLSGGCLIIIGAGILLYQWGRLGHPDIVDQAAVLWPVAIIICSIGAGLFIEKPHVTTVQMPAPALPAPLQAIAQPEPGAPPPTTLGNPDLDRIMQVVTSSKYPLRLALDAVNIDEEGELQTFTLVAERPGYFGDKRQATIVIGKLETIDGEWNFDVDPKRDTVSGTRKTKFPQFIAPPQPRQIVTSTAEAISGYDDFKLQLGVNELGEALEYSPKDYPHWMAIGGTGAGKSVFVRTIIETYRAAGWAIFISDGKKTDYTALDGTPNIVMISSDTAEHVRLMHTVVEEIDRRAVIAQKRKIAGDPAPFAFVPILVILDEFASVRSDVEGLYSTHEGKDADYVGDFLRVLRKGREFRVHACLLTQDLYDKTIPGDARGNIKLIISLGEPKEMTLRKAFPQELQEKARRLGQRITAHGRGLVADPEEATVVEFQGYYGYTPGIDMTDPKVPDHLRQSWKDYHDNVATRIRSLYSRQWFAVESPDDLNEPISVLNALPMVNLDNKDGTPNPQMLQYDKRHHSYNGQVQTADHAGALLELDPTSEDQTNPGDDPAADTTDEQPPDTGHDENPST